MIVLGITGGIGSGKSTVSRILQLRGVPLYDTDARAKALCDADPELRQALVNHFGADIYPASLQGKLDRKRLAALAFASESQTAKLNALVHPVVLRDLLVYLASCRERGEKIVLVESALLHSSGFDRYMSSVVAVVADEPVCLARAMLRDGANEAQVRERMGKQLSPEVIAQKADWVIRNNEGDLILPQLDELWSAIGL